MGPEDVFRNANTLIAETATRAGWRATVPFLCECSDTHCFAQLDLTVEQYDDVRRHPQRYVTVPGHEVEDAVLLEQDDRVALAEKQHARA